MTTMCKSPCRSDTCTPAPPSKRMVKLLCCLSIEASSATLALLVIDTPVNWKTEPSTFTYTEIIVIKKYRAQFKIYYIPSFIRICPTRDEVGGCFTEATLHGSPPATIS